MFDARAAKALQDRDHLIVDEVGRRRLQRYGESLAGSADIAARLMRSCAR